MLFRSSASGASSRSSSFKRPGLGDNTPSTPSPADREAKKNQYDSLRLSFRGGTGSPLAQTSHTPIPSVMTPAAALASSKRRAMSPTSLNKLQAKVLRAKLTNASDADKLEKEYQEELDRAHRGDDEDDTVQTQVEVLPTLDYQGRLYDVGTGKEDAQSTLPGNRKKKEKVRSPHTSSRTSLMLPRLKLTIRILVNSFGLMLTTTQSPLVRCCVKSDSEQVLLIRRISMPSLLALLLRMVALSYVVFCPLKHEQC